ncbi:MAG: quinolinate synthase NadA [Proteobacteria bacterium]|nr:quinolinate synthase NadA [Pseudomonadota bacterium]
MTGNADVLERIKAAKERLGKDLIILAHYYQHRDIVKFADFVGDSLQLAQTASRQKNARYIVFCAVSFMAETARILCSPEQEVFHPEPDARCPLAEMANIDDVEKAWTAIQKTGKKIIPVVYVNSNADLKAFCGQNEGLACTSSNAKKVMEHILSEKKIPLFFPDENLGRNTAHTMGINDSEMFLWDPYAADGDRNTAAIKKAQVFLWRGFCIIHTMFLLSDVERVRKEHDNIKVVVHPECTPSVVDISDFAGSTSFIKDIVEQSEIGSKWAIGTEINFVNSIKAANPDKLVIPLKTSGCREMAKVTPEKLLHVLEGLVEGTPLHHVSVDASYVEHARTALKRMLEIA